MSRPCPTAECEELISDKSEFDTCAVCRSADRYWKKKTPHQRLNRRRKLAKYIDRMDNMLGKVVLMKRRKNG